jgi:hypothetical protein
MRLLGAAGTLGVRGVSATYPSALPGVDVELVATPDGF